MGQKGYIKKHRMTKTKRLFMELAKDPTAKLADLGKRAGFSSKNSKQCAWSALHKVSPAKTALGKILEDDERLTTGVLLKKLAQGLEAYHVTRSVDGEEVKHPDFMARYHYLTLIFKLKGEINPEIQAQVNIMSTLTDVQLAMIIAKKATPYDFLGDKARISNQITDQGHG